MRSISTAANQPLKWVQPSAFRMEYELQAGEEVLASLVFRSSFGTLATTETADGCWTFKRVGFWQTRLTVRSCGEEQDLAVFKNNTWSGGGTLEFPDGRVFRATTNFWQTRLEFHNAAEEILVAFHSGGFFHLSADVEVTTVGATLPELPLLLSLGLYLIIMMQQDSAAGAAVAGGAAG
jgi:hypothetical protein